MGFYESIEHFAFAGFPAGAENTVELKKELSMLRLRVETMEIELKSKDEDIKRLSSTRTPAEERCKVNEFL